MIETMTPTNSKSIPSSPRYDLARDLVFQTLLKHSSDKIPISLSDIVDCFDNIELRSYSWYQKNMGVDKNYIINELTKSEDGGLLIVSDDYEHKEYLILYESEKMVGRKRFTIAHELGHYLLEHHSLINETVISRGKLSKKEYEVLEKEANFFARMLLVPLPLLSHIASNWGKVSRQNIMDIFNVTYTVSQNVINHINNLNRYGCIPINKKIVNKYKTSLNKYINIHTCNKCLAEFISDKPSYCPICGDNAVIHIMSTDYEIYNEFERDDYMIYDGIKVDGNSKAVICPNCGNEEPNEGNFCSICGEFITNMCTNTSPEIVYELATDHPSQNYCSQNLDGNARYCTHCGAESTFLRKGFLKPWQQVEEEHEDEDESYFFQPYAVDDIPF